MNDKAKNDNCQSTFSYKATGVRAIVDFTATVAGLVVGVVIAHKLINR